MKKTGVMIASLIVASFLLAACSHKKELTPNAPQTQESAIEQEDGNTVDSLESELDTMQLDEETFQ